MKGRWATGRQRLLLRSAYLLTGDAHRAEDLVQEALTKVALRWSRLADGNPTAYALTIITRDNISWWRRRREVPRESAVDGAARREEPEIAMVVLDAATGDVVGYAPIRDRSSIYSDNGYLSVQGFLDAETLLLLVGPMDYRTMEPGEEQWHLVAWQFRSGDFELISTGDTGMRTIEVVPDLL